jgi:hypothetical protein
MIHRVVTVWRDEENDPPIVRVARDFGFAYLADQYVIEAIAAGFIRVETTRTQMPDGTCLAVVYVPLGQVIGWYRYELPDTAPPAIGKLQ